MSRQIKRGCFVLLKPHLCEHPLAWLLKRGLGSKNDILFETDRPRGNSVDNWMWFRDEWNKAFTRFHSFLEQQNSSGTSDRWVLCKRTIAWTLFSAYQGFWAAFLHEQPQVQKLWNFLVSWTRAIHCWNISAGHHLTDGQANHQGHLGTGQFNGRACQIKTNIFQANVTSDNTFVQSEHITYLFSF